MKKSTIQTVLVILLALAIMVFGDSCRDRSSFSGMKSTLEIKPRQSNIPDSITFRVKRIYFYDSIKPFTSFETELKKFPNGFRTGDTVRVGDKYYHLLLHI